LPRVAAADRETGPRQSMAVGGYRLQRRAVDDEQHAVAVVAEVLLRHREFRELQQAPEITLRERERLQLLLADVDARIVAGRERLQIEARPARAHAHLA